MKINVYVDESGDQGWKLDKSYSNGGSSTLYTCSFLIVPTHKANLTKKIIEKIYTHWKLDKKTEVKGSELSNKIRLHFARLVVNLLELNKDIKLRTVVVKKKKVPPRIREESFDLLRNHILYYGIRHDINRMTTLLFFPDKRPTSNARIHSAKDYITSKIWFDHCALINIYYRPQNSSDNLNLIFTDWISNTCWRFFENEIATGFEEIKEYIDIVHFNF